MNEKRQNEIRGRAIFNQPILPLRVWIKIEEYWHLRMNGPRINRLVSICIVMLLWYYLGDHKPSFEVLAVLPGFARLG